ncbi:hypothetical protein [Actinokineospora inagensis]|uniref:hypothetical protein n=1 Tax=Actinokineospora inagensis TaxID=103730 RepID=UPI0004215838|nr:hypothetical protein [Actinokineospora inagensis]
MNVNKGFQVFGGTVHTGPTAIGDNAHAVQNGVDPLALVNTIQRLLAAHPETPTEATAVTDEVATELTAEKPDKRKLQRLLDHLAKVTAPVDPVAKAVNDLSAAVTATNP